MELGDGPITIVEAAKYLRVSTKQVARLEQAEGLPVHRMTGHANAAKRYYRTELDEWLRSRWSSRQNGKRR